MPSEVIEKYKCDIPHHEDDKLVGRKRYETMLVGCLPFSEQELYFSTLSNISIMLLAGKYGCGKRTLENAFIAGYGEMFSGYLRFPFEDAAAKGEEEAVADLSEFLTALGEYADGDDENGEEAFIVSLGTINAVADMPLLCKTLSDGLKKLRDEGKGVLVITGVFDGDIRSLPKSLKRSAVICRVDPPDKEERLEFFEKAFEPVSGYVNDTVGIDFMSEYTEGITFLDLESLIGDLQMYLKAKFVVEVAETSGCDIGEVEMSDIGIDKVNLEKDDFTFLADSYKPEVQQTASPAFDMSALTQALSGLTLNLSSSSEPEKPKEKSPFELLDDDDDPDAIF